MSLDEQRDSAGNQTPEKRAGETAAVRREREREKLRDEIGPPVSAVWQRVEDALDEAAAEADEDEAAQAEIKREALRAEEETNRLAALRFARLEQSRRKLSPEEMKAPVAAMLSAGLDKLWDVRQALTSGYRERDAAGEQRQFEKDCAEFGEAEAGAREAEREEILNGRQWMKEAPLWQQISGLFPDVELGLHPGKRAAGIRALMKRAERLIRWEIRRGEAAGNGEEAKGRDGETATEFAGAEHPEQCCIDATRRTAQWDPLRSVCFYLGIAQRKLSALCREINGLAATQLCDAIRAETLRKKWKKRLAEWLGSVAEREGLAGEAPAARESLTDRAFELLRKLRSERQKTGSHRSSFAWETGFSSYTRMFRACLVCYGLVPQEIEVLLIKEAIGGGATCVFGQDREDTCGLQISEHGLDATTPAAGNSIEN